MKRVLAGGLVVLSVLLLCPAVSLAQYPSELVGFNGPPVDENDVGHGEMFRSPQFSGSTSDYIVPNSADDAFDENDCFRASGMQTEGAAALETYFTWADLTDMDSWLRLTTYNHDLRPNPALDTRGKVRFKITNRSGFFIGQIGLCLGIRETNVPVKQLEDGGTSGSIEWVGVNPALTMIDCGSNGIIDSTVSGDDEIIDTNGVLVISWGPDRVLDSTVNGSSDDVAVCGYYYRTDGGKVPNPALILPANPAPVGVEWDLATGDVSLYLNGNWSSTPTVYTGSVAGMSGDGVLDSGDEFRGTLEHLAITNAEPSSDMSYQVHFAIDELRFEATVADPTDAPVIQAPVFNTNTQVLVDCIEDASVATLYINDVQHGSSVVPGSNDVAVFDVTGVLSAGDVLTATQTANGLESAKSLPIVVYEEGTALADSFDSYDSQEALEQIWQLTESDNDRKVHLATGSAASCDNYVVSNYLPGPTVSKLYASIGSLNGTDAEPLVVTYKYRHDSNTSSARARFELAPELSRTYGAVGFAFTNGIGGAFGDQYLTITNSPEPILPGYTSDYFGYDYALTGKPREANVWHEMKIEVKTNVVNFYIDGENANPIGTNGLPVTTNGVEAYANGVRRVSPSTPYKYIVLGVGYSNSIESMYDDIAVTLGDTPVPFGPANTVESPSVIGPLFPGDTQVAVADVDSNAVQVAVYVERAQVASVSGPFSDNTATVNIPANLTDGQEVTATQTLSEESCLSQPLFVSVPTITVQSGLVPGQTTVSVSDLEENLAGLVSLYVDLGEGDYEFVGELANPTSDPVLVPVTSEDYASGLVNGTTIVATQSIAGQEGPKSDGVVVTVPAPTLVGPLEVDDTQITVADVHPLAQSVTVYIDDDTYSVTASGTTQVVATVDPLSPQATVRATQTIGGVEGDFSNPIIVANYVTVNEFNYDDPSTDNLTFIELYNGSDEALDLGGWIVQVGDYVAGQTPPGVYYEHVIASGTTIASHGYWTIGMADVATIPNAVVDVTDASISLGDGQNYIALRSPAGVLLDAVAWEMNKGNTLIPDEIYGQIGTGIWGNHVNAADPATSQSRFLDGLDSDSNGRDFGIQKATPGFSNNMPNLTPYTQTCESTTALDAVDDWVFSYVAMVAIDPTFVDSNGSWYNPTSIPASPNGGQAMIAWDPSGGGNAVYMSQMAQENFTLETYIYVAPEFTPSGYEETKIGLRGSCDGVHNFDYANGATGVAWFLQRGSTWQSLYLIDENDGGDGASGEAICAGQVFGQIIIGEDVALTGWQRLLLEVRGDRVLGIFGGTFGSRTDGIQIVGTHESPGPGGVYVSYREAMTETGVPDNRPPTLDQFTLTTPADLPSGDFDDDGDVDLADFANFQACFGQTGLTAGDACLNGDFDGDYAITIGDYTWFESLFVGP